MTAETEARRAVFAVTAIGHSIVVVPVSAEGDHAATRAVLSPDGVCVAVTGEVLTVGSADLHDRQMTLTPRSQLDDAERRTDDELVRLWPPTSPEVGA
jgi:hypothetical protein